MPKDRNREFDWKAVAVDALKTITTGPAADSAKAVQFALDCIASLTVQEEPAEMRAPSFWDFQRLARGG